MSNAKKVMKATLKQAKELRKEQKKYLKEHKEQLAVIANGLVDVQEYLINITFDGTRSVDINFAGDHHVFNGAWAALRKLGYEPNQRPKEEKVAAYSCFFDKEDWPRIWFSFSSTKCKRKQIGTKMVETPVYETVCE